MQRIRIFRKLYVVVMEKDGYYIDQWENITGDIPEITKGFNNYYTDAIKVFICADPEQAEKVLELVMIGFEIAGMLSA